MHPQNINTKFVRSYGDDIVRLLDEHIGAGIDPAAQASSASLGVNTVDSVTTPTARLEPHELHLSLAAELSLSMLTAWTRAVAIDKSVSVSLLAPVDVRCCRVHFVGLLLMQFARSSSSWPCTPSRISKRAKTSCVS